MRTYVIGLGTNLGDREQHLVAATEALSAMGNVEVVARSHVYETEPLGPPQPRYLNAAIRVVTPLAPRAMLAACNAVEAQLGRVRVERWGARTIDLDILVMLGRDGESEPFVDDALVIPHVGLAQRAFALAPLLDVAPELHSTYGAALDELGRPTRALVRVWMHPHRSPTVPPGRSD